MSTPVTVNDAASAVEDIPPATANGNVLANDSSLEGQPLTVQAVAGSAVNVGQTVQGTYGTVRIGSDGAYLYTLNNASQATQRLGQGVQVVDQFTYTAMDTDGHLANATLAITVTGTNDAPTASNVTVAVQEAPGQNTSAGNVLTSASDVDTGDQLTVSAVSGNGANVGQAVTGVYGSLTISANGAYTYVLDTADADTRNLAAGETGVETFSYTVSDGKGGFVDALFSVNVAGYDPPPAQAIGPEITVTSSAGRSSVATLESGDYVVAWTTYQNIRAQIFHADGTKVGAELLLRTDILPFLAMEVAALEGGGFVASWILGEGGPLRAQEFNGAGQALGSITTVNSSNTELTVQVAGMDSGGYAIAWRVQNSDYPERPEVLVSIFDGADGTVASNIVVNTVTAGAQQLPAIASLGDGLIVTWTDSSGLNGDPNQGIKAQILSATGAKIGGEFLVNTETAGIQTNPEVAELASGGFVIAWQSGTAVKAQMFDATGVKVGGEFLVATVASGSASLNQVLGLSSGGFVINTSQVTRFYDADGVAQAGELRIGWVDMTELPNDQLLTTWNDGGVKSQVYDLEVTRRVTEGSAANDQLVGSVAPDVLLGLGGDDVLDGAEGNDTLLGDIGADVLYGRSGVDVLYGQDGNDTLDGGAGDDRLFGALGNDVVLAGSGNDYIEGGAGADILYGDAGIDLIVGDAGADIILGGAGADLILGGDDADVLYGQDDDDRIQGGAGADEIHGGAGADTVSAGLGDDYVTGGLGADILLGEEGADTISGGDAADVLFGLIGNDTLYGDAGADQLYGGEGDDTLVGGSENDVIEGSLGADTLLGEDGADALFGGDGTDTLYGQAGDDALYGQAGADHLHGGDGGDTLLGGSEDDLIEGAAGADTLLGESGNDTLLGGDDADTLYGQDGNDMLGGGAGADQLAGGSGDDVILAGSEDDYLEGADGADVLYGEAGADVMVGGSGADIMLGGAGADLIVGGDDADTLRGEDGDDILVGGTGNDWFVGGSGDDLFAYAAGDGSDVIEDFDPAGNDRIQFTGLGWTSVNDVFAASTQVGDDLVIDTLGGTVTLLGVSAGSLSGADFNFG